MTAYPLVFSGNSTAETGTTHSSPATAQAITIPYLVSGSVATGDAGTDVNLLINGSSYPRYIEDWYSITTTQAALPYNVLHIDLDFSGGAASDLDLFLFNKDATGFYEYSAADNIQTNNYTESVWTTLLTAGTYLIGVDAYDTSKGGVNYKLDVYFGISPNKVKVYDWFAVTLNSSQKISVNTTNGWAVVLMDNTDNTALASGVPTADGGAAGFLSPVLHPGTYYIGMASNSHARGPYTMSVNLQ